MFGSALFGTTLFGSAGGAIPFQPARYRETVPHEDRIESVPVENRVELLGDDKGD